MAAGQSGMVQHLLSVPDTHSGGSLMAGMGGWLFFREQDISSRIADGAFCSVQVFDFMKLKKSKEGLSLERILF